MPKFLHEMNDLRKKRGMMFIVASVLLDQGIRGHYLSRDLP